MSKFIISYDNKEGLFGFKIFDQNMAKSYMKAVKLLSEESIEINSSNCECSVDFNCFYDEENFSIVKIGQSELKVLYKLFLRSLRRGDYRFLSKCNN